MIFSSLLFSEMEKPINIFGQTMTGKTTLRKLLESVWVKCIEEEQMVDWQELPEWTQVIFTETPMEWCEQFQLFKNTSHLD